MALGLLLGGVLMDGWALGGRLDRSEGCWLGKSLFAEDCWLLGSMEGSGEGTLEEATDGLFENSDDGRWEGLPDSRSEGHMDGVWLTIGCMEGAELPEREELGLGLGS